MSLYHQPKVSTDGLIYCFDPSNLRCVPTTASGLRDQDAISAFGSGFTINEYQADDEIIYRSYIFNTVGTHSLIVPDLVDVSYLIVAGGGGGGSSLGGGAAGGGGGAGGYLEGSFSTLSAGTYSVVVGDGGVGGDQVADDPGDDGQNSSVFGLNAIGGGGGGPRGGSGRNGGSGGGANEPSAGSGTSGQGFGGGTSDNPVSPSAGGGGGGAGGAGANASADFYYAGAGGVGRESSITGTATFYAGGGGGGNGWTPASGFGGNGGGGDGGDAIEPPNTSRNLPGYDGTDGLGGGGGGGAGRGAGGAGGSGIVVVRFPLISKPYNNLYVDYRGGNYSSLRGRYVGTTFSGDRFVYSVPANSAVRNSFVLDYTAGFNDNEEFTLNFWVKLDASALENAYSLAGRFTTNGHIYVDQETALLDGSEWILRWRTQGNTTFDLTDLITDTNIKQQYVNITVSCDSSRSVKTYLNGVLRKTTTVPDTSAMTILTLFGGYRSSTLHLSWHGFVGPAHIYGRQLSDREVRDNYLAYAPRYA